MCISVCECVSVYKKEKKGGKCANICERVRALLTHAQAYVYTWFKGCETIEDGSHKVRYNPTGSVLWYIALVPKGLTLSAPNETTHSTLPVALINYYQ